MMEKRPFEGVHVIDMSWAGVGAFVAGTLAQFGATTVRVESGLRPDPMRAAPPLGAPIDGSPETGGLERSGYFSQFHPYPAYDLLLNLNKPKAVDVLKRLVPWADILIECFTGRQMEKWGLGYDDLRKIKPDIIMFRTCGFGQTGPLSKVAGFGTTLSAMSGLYELTGWPDRPSVPPSNYYSDMLSAMQGTLALLAALDNRRRTGKGQCIDHSQVEASVSFLTPLVLDYSAHKRLIKRAGNKVDYAAPHGTYRCKGEDRWVAIAVCTDEEWESFCGIVGNPPWTKDERFSTLENRLRNSDDLDRLVNIWTMNLTAEEVMTMLQAGGVGAGLVEDAKDQTEDPQLSAYNYFQEMDHPYLGTRRYYHPQNFVLSEAVAEVKAPVLLGEHTEYVATQIVGMADKEFIELLQEGVFE
jgi:crotonobetainyl-CoA:carnitine CoA-transferase CaiB-like acyl-CoA transferase